ncbi:MAG: hypothetical protein M1830_003589 [Pleopsidium flavum]|nr:MAG: hypothetical protein M1830_003589 [Pleopsidium flavum]
MDDFVLYPGHEAYTDMLAQQQARHENVYNSQQYTLDDQLVDMTMTTYESIASVTALSSAPTDFYEASRFVVDAPQDNLKHEPYRYTPPGSPSNSASHSFDHPSSTMSSTSGPSVQSANSSAVGSPYSRSTHILPSREPWTESGHGLGIGPGIISHDGYCQGDYVSASLEHEITFAQEKLPGDFVGKCTEVSSSHGSVRSAPLSSSISNTFCHSSTPALAVNTSVRGSGMTIDTILHEVDSRVGTPGMDSSPDSTRVTNTSPYISRNRHRTKSAPKNADLFRSPSTPASVTSSFVPRPRSPVVAPRTEIRGQSLINAGVKKSKSSPRSSPGHFLYGRPTPPPSSPVLAYASHFQTPFFSQSSGNFVAPLESSYPSLIQPFQTPITHNTTAPYPGVIHAFHTPSQMFQPPSPAPSNSSVHSQTRSISANLKARSQSPYPYTPSFQPYPLTSISRRPSISSSHSRYSLHSQRSGSFEVDDENNHKGRCPNPDCGRVFKDLKAHMLTHQSERPEKCPIVTCEYHHKGFARKYDKNRHTLTHYKGTMVCGFCPGSGSAAEKSFNRADVFKRHLTSVHGVEQTPPNSRKRIPSAGSLKKITSYPPDATGRCSTCSATFNNAQDFYEHLDDCVLRIVQQEEPSEAINQRRLTEVANDQAVQETMNRHMLPNNVEYGTQGSSSLNEEQEEEDDEDENDDNHDTLIGHTGARTRSGKGSIESNKRNSSRGLTSSKGGVPLVGKGRKKRMHYPLSWGCSAEKMKMKKRVLCVYDGPRRLWKDDMMLDNEFEVRMKLADGKSYITDLDVETLKRAQALHGATEGEKGPWSRDDMREVDIQELMA